MKTSLLDGDITKKKNWILLSREIILFTHDMGFDAQRRILYTCTGLNDFIYYLLDMFLDCCDVVHALQLSAVLQSYEYGLRSPGKVVGRWDMYNRVAVSLVRAGRWDICERRADGGAGDAFGVRHDRARRRDGALHARLPAPALRADAREPPLAAALPRRSAPAADRRQAAHETRAVPAPVLRAALLSRRDARQLRHAPPVLRCRRAARLVPVAIVTGDGRSALLAQVDPLSHTPTASRRSR